MPKIMTKENSYIIISHALARLQFAEETTGNSNGLTTTGKTNTNPGAKVNKNPEIPIIADTICPDGNITNGNQSRLIDDSSMPTLLRTLSQSSDFHRQLQSKNNVNSEADPPPPLIICDAWYGFPTQKRPRKERICAVSRQLANFLSWRSDNGSKPINAKGNDQQNTNEAESKSKSLISFSSDCSISLLGKQEDVQSVSDRMAELREKGNSSNIGHEISFDANIDINSFIDNWRKSHPLINSHDAVYLSPDATETLSAVSPPPRIVLIGMLIDRRITTNRSRLRAEETLKLRAAKLPLDELKVAELSSEEPLNVDVVLELMQRWWWNCEKLEQKCNMQQDGKVNKKVENSKLEKSNLYRGCFINAASWAIRSHRERHPNRTVHLSS